MAMRSAVSALALGGGDFPPPEDMPGARMSESPIDHALTLLLAGETDAAMRWAAAVLEKAPSPGALLVTCRLLDQMGRTRAAIEGLRHAVQIAVDRGDLPLSVAAIDDLRTLGAPVEDPVETVAAAFCRGSSRLRRPDAGPKVPSLPGHDFVQPLSPFLAGPALASKATRIVQDTRHRYDDTVGGELTRIMPVPLFSALPKEALCDVLWVFHAVTVPSGHKILVEGDESNEAYVVVRGEVEIARRAPHGDNKFTLALARLGGGAFFGEMALLSLMPSPASATATRPSILLKARRDALVDVAATRPEIAGQLATHCRRNSLANLGWTSQVVSAVPPSERASLVERLEMRLFEKGDLLVRSGEESPGLHLIVSGEVAIVAREWGERVMLATLGAGDTVGEMELVLCRQPFADAVATGPAATLFLSRSEYASLIQDHPAILSGLYAIAVQRQAETTFALRSGSAVVADDWLLDANRPSSPPPEPPPEVDAVDAAAPTEKPGAARETREVRGEVLDSCRPFAGAPVMPIVAKPLPPPAPPAPVPSAAKKTVVLEKPVMERPTADKPASRRTVPPPPLPLVPPPSSISPTVASARAPSLVMEAPRRASWAGVAVVTGMTAVAASVVTILALRGTDAGSTAAPTGAAAHAPPVAMETLPAMATANPITPVPAPVLTAALPPSRMQAPPTPQAAPAPTTATAPVPAKIVPGVHIAPPFAAPVGTVHRVAAATTIAHTEPPPKAAAAEDDEFGGRN